jgi:hypothetical protein
MKIAHYPDNMLSSGFRKWARIAGLLTVLSAANLQAQILPQATAQIIVESSNVAEVYLDEKAVGTVASTGSLAI